MIERYTFPEMAAVWGREQRFAAWYRVELAWLETLEAHGKVPRNTAKACQGASIDLVQLDDLEAVNRHEMIAFLEMVRSKLRTRSGRVKHQGRWLHHGLTSSDVMDTGLALQLTQALDLIFVAHKQYVDALLDLGKKHLGLLGAGRTHGVFAEPVSFGLRFVRFAATAIRDAHRLWDARQGIAVGKLAGTVGAYSAFSSLLEKETLERLGLAWETAPSQVVARDRHAHLLQSIALCGAGVEAFATEIRHLQRTEVSEVEEPFTSGQKGSSAMPHKRNPIVTERLTGMARVLRGFAQTGLENVALWHERDISHSSTERLTLPTATATLHYMLIRAAKVARELAVDENKVAGNLDKHGPQLLSHKLLLGLIEKKEMSRERAYAIVQDVAFLMRYPLTWEFSFTLKKLVIGKKGRKASPRRVSRIVAEILDRHLRSGVTISPEDRKRVLRALNRKLMPHKLIREAYNEAVDRRSDGPVVRFSEAGGEELFGHRYFRNIRNYLSSKDLADVFRPDYYLGEAPAIYSRVRARARRLPYRKRVKEA